MLTIYLILSITLVIEAFVFAKLIHAALTTRKRLAERRCANCGYPQDSIPPERCPECGVSGLKGCSKNRTLGQNLKLILCAILLTSTAALPMYLRSNLIISHLPSTFWLQEYDSALVSSKQKSEIINKINTNKFSQTDVYLQAVHDSKIISISRTDSTDYYAGLLSDYSGGTETHNAEACSNSEELKAFLERELNLAVLTSDEYYYIRPVLLEYFYYYLLISISCGDYNVAFSSYELTIKQGLEPVFPKGIPGSWSRWLSIELSALAQSIPQYHIDYNGDSLCISNTKTNSEILDCAYRLKSSELDILEILGD